MPSESHSHHGKRLGVSSDVLRIPFTESPAMGLVEREGENLMIEPKLVRASRYCVEYKSCLLIEEKTGCQSKYSIGQIDLEMNGKVPKGILLLDMQTANLIVTVYEALTNKENFQKTIDRIGVTRTVGKCWNSLQKAN